MPFIVIKKFRFEAAHYVPLFPDGHKCREIHGHSFKVEVKLEGDIDPEKGLLVDFADVKAVVQPYIDYLDHSLLNKLGERDNVPLLKNPTTENICYWLYHEVAPKLPMLKSIRVQETENNIAEYVKD